MDIGLTRLECITFLKDVIKLSVPQEMTNGDRKPDFEFLNATTRAFMEQIPFQSVTLISVPLEQRHFPTWSQIKDAMFKRHGGVCHSLNGFMFYLLKGLDYEVTLGYATVTMSPNPVPADHVIIFVKNVIKSGDTFLVDVGFGAPSFEAVCLDFDSESTVYKHSFLEYKYFKRGDKIFRAHGKGDSNFGKTPETWQKIFGPWIAAYEFTTENVRPFEDCVAFYKETYKNPDLMSFHTSLRSTCFPNGHAVAIRHNKLLEEEDGILKKTTLPSSENIVNSYLKHFPQFEEEMIRRSITNWRCLDSSA